VGEIHLQSQLYVFPFQADKDGVVSKEINVPFDIELGDHLVSVCWGGTCHVHATLTVVSGVSLATPSPTSSPSSSPSPSPSTTPRSTPTPSPFETRQAISANPSSQLVLMTVTVTGVHFSAFRGVSIALFDPSSSTRALQFWSVTTGADGRFQKSITIPATAKAGTARITACDTNRLCASTTITVIG
jgi:hypothetical protein